MKRIFLFFTALFTAGTAFAAPGVINEGLFTSPNLCNVRAINDQFTGNVVMEFVSGPNNNCSDAGTSFVLTRKNDAIMDFSDSETVDSAWLKTCIPTRDNAQPCDSWLYAGNGKLLAQIGDKLQTDVSATILNPTAFRFVKTLSLIRGDKLVQSSLSFDGYYTQWVDQK
jgi:hypothetical protein